MENTQILEKMNSFEEDSKWLYNNLDLLRKRKLSGQFVAIKNKEVIAQGEDINLVIKQVEKKGENPSYILIEYIYPEGTIILL